MVLLHEGGTTSTAGNGAGAGVDRINDCVNPTGALPPIVEGMDDAVDVVVTGHTNWAVNCVIDDKIVTGAGANGRIVTDIDLTIDNKSRDVVVCERQQPGRLPGRREGGRPDRSRREVQGALGAAGQQGGRLDHGRHHPDREPGRRVVRTAT